MRYWVLALLTLLLCGALSAQDHANHAQSRPVTMVSGLGDLHHPVSTSNAEAQKFFDQGLRFIYAFNHDEAARSFGHAAELDPKLAMAYWGVAEAVGPNYNDPASDDRFKRAHEAIQKAGDLSAAASPVEKAYVQAMALRFPGGDADRRQAAEAYHAAMRAVAKNFPGDYDAAVKTNEKAAAVDQAYLKASGAQGIYPMMYYSHNLHFIAMCSAMNGNYEEAKKTAGVLAAHVGPHVKEMPPLEGFMTIPIAVNVRFHRWDDILKMPQPDPAMKTTTVFWHFARGMALAATGKVADADGEYKIVSDAEEATSPDVVFAMPVNNKAKDVLRIARDVLGAKIALAKKDNAGAIAKLQSAVATQDMLKYSEPEDWFFPVRESLGAALLMNSDAAGAEKIFREDIETHPRNPRSLFGLQQALKAQKRDYDAGFVEKQFQSSWKGQGAQLRVEDLV